MSSNSVFMDVTVTWIERPEDYPEATWCAMARTDRRRRDEGQMRSRRLRSPPASCRQRRAVSAALSACNPTAAYREHLADEAVGGGTAQIRRELSVLSR